jgi:hypothetical protein
VGQDRGVPRDVEYVFVETMNKIEKLFGHDEVPFELSNVADKMAIQLWKMLRDEQSRRRFMVGAPQKEIRRKNEIYARIKEVTNDAEREFIGLPPKGFTPEVMGSVGVINVEKARGEKRKRQAEKAFESRKETGRVPA